MKEVSQAIEKVKQEVQLSEWAKDLEYSAQVEHPRRVWLKPYIAAKSYMANKPYTAKNYIAVLLIILRPLRFRGGLFGVVYTGLFWSYFIFCKRRKCGIMKIIFIFQKELQFLRSKSINFVGFHFRKSCNKTTYKYNNKKKLRLFMLRRQPVTI